MIFSIFKTYKDVKSGVNDPTGFGRDLMLDMIKVPILIFTISGIFALGLFYAFGWTSFLGGPWGFFRFAFFFFLIPFTFVEIFIWFLYGKIKKLVERAKRELDREDKTIEVEVK